MNRIGSRAALIAAALLTAALLCCCGGDAPKITDGPDTDASPLTDAAVTDTAAVPDTGETDVPPSDTIYISAAGELSALTGQSSLPLGIDTIEFADGIVLDGTLTLDRDITLVFVGSVDGVLRVVRRGEGVISVHDNGGGVESSVFLDAPECALIWESASGDIPDIAYIDQYDNVASCNGEDCDPEMGGVGVSRILMCEIALGDVARTAVVDGNLIVFTVGALDPLELDEYEKTAAASGGEAEFIRGERSWRVDVTDADGGVYSYRVDVRRERHYLPVVSISTFGAGVSSTEKYIKGTFSIDYGGAFDLDPIENAEISIRGRGHSSWKLDKKPYKIKFTEAASLFGLHRAKRWVMIANHVDRSLIRNKLAYTIGAELDNLVFVPSANLVDVYVDGEYQGVYQISEQVEINEGRVPGEEDSAGVDTDYLLEIGSNGVPTTFGGYNIFTHRLFRFVEIRSPEVESLTKEQYDYIKAYVKSVEQAVMDGGNYAELLDVPSLVDWFLLYEFSYNLDGMFRLSDFMLKKKSDKLYFCTPWDFDYAFGNMNLDTDAYDDWISLGNSKTDAYDNYIEENIMDYLLRDPYFISCLKARWDEVGERMLNVGLGVVDDAERTVSPSAEDNFTRWPILGVKIQFERMQTARLGSYGEHLDYLRNFMRARYDWMDHAIAEL